MFHPVAAMRVCHLFDPSLLKSTRRTITAAHPRKWNRHRVARLRWYLSIFAAPSTKPLSTVHELSTFSSFRKNISVLVADLTEISSRLIIIPKRNKIEKDLYRTVVSPSKTARTMPIVSCYACLELWYTPKFLLRQIFPMWRFLHAMSRRIWRSDFRWPSRYSTYCTVIL